MNVGGRRAGGDELRSCFEQMGFEDVATFRASGNVMFDAPKGGVAALNRKIEAGLQKALGYDVTVFLRSAKEMQAIAAEQPFDAKLVNASKGKPQVALLGKRLDAKGRKRLAELSGNRDRLVGAGQEVHWLPPGGLMDSELGMEGIAKA
ncbi:MAG: DUF1697 domain-containing protein, partial [Actinomycetota bacterium]|nr:DUF1697 domain-containing protein [Actinomycetota bacterium]